MASLRIRDLEIDYDERGQPTAPAVLLIMGLGMPGAMWPDAFIDGLVARGLRVIRFDNRDCGRSTRLDDIGAPNLAMAIGRALLRLPVRAPYTLEDMAGDALGVLDALGVERAHLVGASMGGMIAQVLAAHWPERVATLTSIMSTSGNPRPSIAFGEHKALRAVLSRPAQADVDSVVDHLLGVFGVIGSPAYPLDPAVVRPHFEQVVQRGLHPPGTARQLAAILASGDRRTLLARIEAPTLVIHGAADPLLPVAAGRDTARHIHGAKFEVIEGMGHNLPTELQPVLATLVADHCLAATSPTQDR